MKKKATSQFADTPAFAELQTHLTKPEGERDAMWELELGRLVGILFPITSRRTRDQTKRSYAQGNIQALSTALGGTTVLTNKLWNARKLAKDMPKKEIAALLRLAKKRSFELTASHVLTLATVRSPEKREAIGKKCVEQQLGIRQLRREIYSVQVKKSQGGASPTKPKSVDEALHDLVERTSTWLNFYNQAWFADEECSLERPLSTDESMRLSGDLNNAISLLRDLEKAAVSGKRRLLHLRYGAKD